MSTTEDSAVARSLDELARRLGHEKERDVPISRGEVYALLVELIMIVDRISRSERG